MPDDNNTPSPQDSIQALQAFDQQAHLHPFTDPSAIKSHAPFMIERGDGIFVEGQGFRLMDGMAGLGCVNIGYGRAEMADAARDAMMKLPFYHSFAAVSNPEAAKLAHAIAKRAPQADARVFFANSGSEANESIVKMARLYWRLKGKPSKRIIISRNFAYHGSTELTSALNGNPQMHQQFGIDGHGEVRHAIAPFWYREGGGDDPETFAVRAAGDIARLIDEAGSDNVAAVIAEPIMGTSGAILPPPGYHQRVAEICRSKGVLLIADEVVTGFGRTGHWFAQDLYGYTADFMTLAKGLSSAYLPISAAVVSGEVASVLDQGAGVFQHGFTTSAHPVTAAVALKNLEIIEREGLVERIRDDIGPYFSTALKRLEGLPIVGEVRVQGLIAGIEIVRDKASRTHFDPQVMIDEHIGQGCLVRGLIIRPVGNALVLCPPFIISRAEVDQMVAVIEDAIRDVIAKLG